MAQLERLIEERLIDQLCCGESQWVYRDDIKTEEQLWSNFKYILEQNNKAKLNDTPLTESEFAKIKNDLSHSSFYDAAQWLAGENGKVYVHVQRGNEVLHLEVMDNNQIAGGKSVYEAINQYQAFVTEEEKNGRDRRFDVSLLINGIPLIHIELKNENHSYFEGYNQIKKYIEEGKFQGIFSNIQMFVVSNGCDTKYFAAGRSSELNKKFITGWVDEQNQPVCDYIDFAKNVLKIPNAHEMVTKYVVLDNDKKKLLILRPYQIHAIDAMRAASRLGKSGYIWHTTGSGKTMTSYKSTRNLLMDIPSIDKTVFLIDRKELDDKTTMDFQSYAKNDTIDVDDTEHVEALIERLGSSDRQMIVTTRQKMQTMINRKLKESHPKYKKIKNLRIAFVVDECHRAVTPETKRAIERFFKNSLWYGFTGTPIFEKNAYEQRGDLPRTTQQLYGECLHEYTIKEAIHDEAVLGFMVETLGPNENVEDDSIYKTEKHMRQVLDVILNKSQKKFGMHLGKGKTYEAMLTVDSIPMAQKYYALLKRIKEGNDELKICDAVKKSLPDFPKFAITYSLSENKDDSKIEQDLMQNALDDYNEMFGEKYTIEGIDAYNKNLNERLARKNKRYIKRSEQLDIVIVVKRLLTGFDAPCMSTLFVDKKPMAPQDLIQAFSRTNRLFDKDKQYGQIVTFRSPIDYKKAIDEALKLYSRGGDGSPLAEDWNQVKERFGISLNALRDLVKTPNDIALLSKAQKKVFVRLFRAFDTDLSHLKAFSYYEDSFLDAYEFSQEDYEKYAGMYNNIVEELKEDRDDGENGEDAQILDDYELVAYNKLKINFEYILELLQGFVEAISKPEEEFKEEIKQLKEIIDDYAKENKKMGHLLNEILEEICENKENFIGVDISVLIHKMREDAIEKEVQEFAKKWFINPSEVRYEVYHYKNGKISNINNFKDKIDYEEYCKQTEEKLAKFKLRKKMVESFEDELMVSLIPLLEI